MRTEKPVVILSLEQPSMSLKEKAHVKGQFLTNLRQKFPNAAYKHVIGQYRGQIENSFMVVLQDDRMLNFLLDTAKNAI